MTFSYFNEHIFYEQDGYLRWNPYTAEDPDSLKLVKMI